MAEAEAEAEARGAGGEEAVCSDGQLGAAAGSREVEGSQEELPSRGAVPSPPAAPATQEPEDRSPSSEAERGEERGPRFADALGGQLERGVLAERVRGLGRVHRFYEGHECRFAAERDRESYA